jgi:hypothetical protein
MKNYLRFIMPSFSDTSICLKYESPGILVAVLGSNLGLHIGYPVLFVTWKMPKMVPVIGHTSLRNSFQFVECGSL